ncbi:MAG TPA: xanthine dehydrogenase family protein subunit M [Puia sp.]|jgi:xanthine dehydrogenase YagS FAD-binding subunit|nr:xanthine dehydrogenase family protein subunit M [Puia sp.]
MYPFAFIRSQTIPAAIREAGVKGNKFIAGGTNLIDLMKLDIEQPEALIDINGLGLKAIEVAADGRVRIGALVKNSTLAYHPEIQRRFPLLSEALLSGASAQLRNMATTGGNMLQRTRCYYFYDPAFPCNKRVPGSGCPAIDGYNRGNAVLGTSEHCIATHPSDMCVALAALDPLVFLQGPAGTRTIPFRSLHRLPGSTPHLENTLYPGELITGIELPRLDFASRSHYLKVRDRASYEFALASAAVALDISGGRIRQARIALGGVGTKPWRSPEAEAVLAGATADEATYKRAAEAALRPAKAYRHNAFKIELAKRTLVRALNTTGGMA